MSDRKHASSHTKIACAFLSAQVLFGCAVELKKNDWSGYKGPGAEYFQAEELPPFETLSDPIEPCNRTMGIINHGFIVGIVQPLARAYTFIMPEFLRTRISNFGMNLAYPKHLINNLFQGNWKGAGTETLRVLTNTTVGLAGFFDPATAWEIEPSREDFGRTLGKWGWTPPGVYLVAPLYGPTTDRGGLGAIADAAAEPHAWLFPLLPLTYMLTFNDFSGQIDRYKDFTRTQYDPYTLGRYIWRYARSEKDPRYEPAYDNEDERSIQTLHLLLFQVKNPRFPRAAQTRSVLLASTEKKLAYNLWIQPEPAPIVFILPGLGGHRDSVSARALAELVYDRGFSAVTISSVMNFEFMEQASTVAVPGYAPADALDVHRSLDAIARDLTEAYPDRVTSRALLGISLGAFHTLFIAAAEDQVEHDLIAFDRYVAIAPPVALFHGVEQLDRFYNAPLRYPEEERAERIENTLLKIIHLQDREITPDTVFPFDGIEAEFLIGLVFRLTLQDIIHSSQFRHNMGVLKTKLTDWSRANAYREILEFSYMEYFYAFVLPYFQERSPEIRSEEDLIRLTDLRSIEQPLARNQKIRLFPTRNDFLYSPEDIRWLSRVFDDERLHFFEKGGHLGNLHREDVTDRIMESLQSLRLAVPRQHALQESRDL